MSKPSVTRKKPAKQAVKRVVNPISNDESRYMVSFTAQDCIKELLRIVALDETRFITRNHFRNESRISESTWTRHFGSFQEFKRQAGVIPSRQQHQLERHIAKHASVDHYRTIGEERTKWADKYLRKQPGRFKTIILASDLHDIEIDPFYLRVLIDTVKRVTPDVVSLVGDVFDLPEFGKYGVDPREWDVVGRIKFAHEKILRPIREASPESQFDLIEGNHEFRMLRHMADATPALKAVLSDLHGFTVSKLLGLDQFEINYVAGADMAAFSKQDITRELPRNSRIYWDTYHANHFPNARDMGLPGVNGHNHKHIVWPMFNPIYGAYEWHQLGCGHKRRASYCNGEKWHMGFALAHVDTHTHATITEYFPITDFAVVGGKYYHRLESELMTVAGNLFG